jgi:hypothetical protein
MGLVCRAGGNRYALKLHSLNGTQTGVGAANVSQRALRVLEEYIYSAPHQWYQWKQVRVILGTEIFEVTRPIHATEPGRTLPLADSLLAAS